MLNLDKYSPTCIFSSSALIVRMLAWCSSSINRVIHHQQLTRQNWKWSAAWAVWDSINSNIQWGLVYLYQYGSQRVWFTTSISLNKVYDWLYLFNLCYTCTHWEYTYFEFNITSYTASIKPERRERALDFT